MEAHEVDEGTQRSFFRQWCETGQQAEAFWSQTPRSTILAIQAHRQRRDREHEISARIGWLSARLNTFSFHSPDKFPDFDALSGAPRQEPPREVSEREAIDGAREVLAMMKTANRMAEKRRRRGQEPDR